MKQLIINFEVFDILAKVKKFVLFILSFFNKIPTQQVINTTTKVKTIIKSFFQMRIKVNKFNQLTYDGLQNQL